MSRFSVNINFSLFLIKVIIWHHNIAHKSHGPFLWYFFCHLGALTTPIHAVFPKALQAKVDHKGHCCQLCLFTWVHNAFRKHSPELSGYFFYPFNLLLGFHRTQRVVNNDRNYIFWWTIPLNNSFLCFRPVQISHFQCFPICFLFLPPSPPFLLL